MLPVGSLRSRASPAPFLTQMKPPEERRCEHASVYQECQMHQQAAFTARHVAANDGAAWHFDRRLNTRLLL